MDSSNQVESGGPIKKKRGRKSLVPPELREQTRKLKKQNMERQRRASIAEKMSRLYNATLQLVGENPEQHQKVEKADILNVCCNVLKGVSDIISKQPDVLEKVHQLKSTIHHAAAVASSSSQSSNSAYFNENTTEFTDNEESCDGSDRIRFPSFTVPSTNQNLLTHNIGMQHAVPNTPFERPSLHQSDSNFTVPLKSKQISNAQASMQPRLYTVRESKEFEESSVLPMLPILNQIHSRSSAFSPVIRLPDNFQKTSPTMPFLKPEKQDEELDLRMNKYREGQNEPRQHSTPIVHPAKRPAYMSSLMLNSDSLSPFSSHQSYLSSDEHSFQPSSSQTSVSRYSLPPKLRKINERPLSDCQIETGVDLRCTQPRNGSISSGYMSSGSSEDLVFPQSSSNASSEISLLASSRFSKGGGLNIKENRIFESTSMSPKLKLISKEEEKENNPTENNKKSQKMTMWRPYL